MEEKQAPGQILCFLELDEEQAEKGKLDGAGPYAVVRSFKEDAKPAKPSKLVRRGCVDDKHFVYSCAAICGTVAVVKNENNDEMENEFFVVSNSNDWLDMFHEILDNADEANVSEEDSDDDELNSDDGEGNDGEEDCDDDEEESDDDQANNSEDDSEDDEEDGDDDDSSHWACLHCDWNFVKNHLNLNVFVNLDAIFNHS